MLYFEVNMKKNIGIIQSQRDGEKGAYINSVLLLDKLYKVFLNVVKKELTNLNVNDINNIQSLILYNLGRDQIYITELISRGYYIGSNVSYNLKKLVHAGYIEQTQSTRDKRSSLIKLSKKGLDLLSKIESIFDKQIKTISKINNRFNPKTLNSTLNEMDQVLNNFLKN